MLMEIKRHVDDVDFSFQNQPSKIIFLKSVPQMEFTGKKVGPFDKGVETELPQWITEEIVESGFAKYSGGDMLSIVDITKAHWRESLPKSRSMSSIKSDFYYRLRKLLNELKSKGREDMEKLKEYEKTLSISNDILNCRLKKIVLLASSQYQSEEVKKNMASEEKFLLEELSKTIKEWREAVLKVHE